MKVPALSGRLLGAVIDPGLQLLSAHAGRPVRTASVSNTLIRIFPLGLLNVELNESKRLLSPQKLALETLIYSPSTKASKPTERLGRVKFPSRLPIYALRSSAIGTQNVSFFSPSFGQNLALVPLQSRCKIACQSQPCAVFELDLTDRKYVIYILTFAGTMEGCDDNPLNQNEKFSGGDSRTTFELLCFLTQEGCRSKSRL